MTPFTAAFHDRPFSRLTRHFLGSLSEFDVLSDVGAESFKRLIVGICAVFRCNLLQLFIGRFPIAQPEPALGLREMVAVVGGHRGVGE